MAHPSWGKFKNDLKRCGGWQDMTPAERRGAWQVFDSMDRRASPEEREALLEGMSSEEKEGGAMFLRWLRTSTWR